MNLGTCSAIGRVRATTKIIFFKIDILDRGTPAVAAATLGALAGITVATWSPRRVPHAVAVITSLWIITAATDQLRPTKEAAQ